MLLRFLLVMFVGFLASSAAIPITATFSCENGYFGSSQITISGAITGAFTASEAGCPLTLSDIRLSHIAAFAGPSGGFGSLNGFTLYGGPLDGSIITLAAVFTLDPSNYAASGYFYATRLLSSASTGSITERAFYLDAVGTYAVSVHPDGKVVNLTLESQSLPTPEPGTSLLAGIGLFIMVAARRAIKK